MPLHLSPLNRRTFLQRSVVGGIGLLTLKASGLDRSAINPDHWVLFSDTHIAADQAKIMKDVNVADHLRAAVDAVCSQTVAPAGIFINGDCALDQGLAEDYATFVELISPLTKAGLPVHMTMGNHDNREVFWNSVASQKPASPPIANKHVSVVEADRANWVLLDSLNGVKQVAGSLGDEQRAWLAKVLDEKSDKPAIVMVHHDPMLVEKEKKTGLLDTKELMEILMPRRHVKAVIFGHTHTWRVSDLDGLHLINLPAVAYPFAPAELTGWVNCQLRAEGMSLEVHGHDPQHEDNGAEVHLRWRSA